MFLNVVNLVVQETVMVVPYTGSVHMIFALLQNIVMFLFLLEFKEKLGVFNVIFSGNIFL